MKNEELTQQVEELRDEFNTKVRPYARDQFERASFAKIDALLCEIVEEYSTGGLKSKSERYGYISRLVAESDPAILPPDLGGRLMTAEQEYRQR